MRDNEVDPENEYERVDIEALWQALEIYIVVENLSLA